MAILFTTQNFCPHDIVNKNCEEFPNVKAMAIPFRNTLEQTEWTNLDTNMATRMKSAIDSLTENPEKRIVRLLYWLFEKKDVH